MQSKTASFTLVIALLSSGDSSAKLLSVANTFTASADGIDRSERIWAGNSLGTGKFSSWRMSRAAAAEKTASERAGSSPSLNAQSAMLSLSEGKALK